MLLTGWTTVYSQSPGCDFGQTPCEAYAQADAIFIGKVIRINPQTISIWQRDPDYDQIATVVIEKTYKGIARKRIVLHQLGRKSSPKLVLNSRYLIYANLDRQTKKWEVRRCGRTLMAQYAQDDLRYLERPRAKVKESRIAGAVVRYEPDEETPGGKTQRLAGIKIRIKGEEKEYEAVTDATGIYELYGVPAGKYVIDLDIPSGLKLMGVIHHGPFDRSKLKSLNIELKDRECSGVMIFLERGKP